MMSAQPTASSPSFLTHARVLTAKVMHKRLTPKVNGFAYGLYYLVLPLPLASDTGFGWHFGINRPGILSVRARDHGARDGGDLRTWALEQWRAYGLETRVHHIELVTLPRVLGYVFNPVSFFLGRDDQGHLRTVIAEVNNTFGETHSYVCAPTEDRPIRPDEWLMAEKEFHVSPFLPRDGGYRFRFDVDHPDRFGVWIDHLAPGGEVRLKTALLGACAPLTARRLRMAFWRHPLVTLKAIGLIHWQALKLLAKGIRYIAKPEQNPDRLSRTTSEPDKMNKS